MKPTRRPVRPLLRARTLVLGIGLGLSLAVLLPAAQADEVGPDPLGTLLGERGLPGPGSTGFVQSVRNSVRDKASDMVLAAMNFLGVPYRRGGNDQAQGFDCSGFTRHIFEMSLGQVLPRRVDEQAKAPGLLSIRRDELKPGDLVFFNTLRRTFSHVGIYVGDDKFIHAPKPGGEVRIEDMRQAYWARRFTGARRTPLASLDAVGPESPGVSSRQP